MGPPPALADVAALAERALGHLEGPGQVDVVWKRRIAGGESGDALSVTVTAIHEGRAARATTADDGDAALARAAKAAGVQARRMRALPAPPLPDPAPGEAHDGFDARVLEPSTEHRTGHDLALTWEAGAARTAVASTTGVRAAEERSHVVARAACGPAVVTLAGTGPVDVAGAAAEARALAGAGASAGPFGPHVPDAPAAPPEPGAEGRLTVVFGPEAVAAMLDALRTAFGVDAAMGSGLLDGRLGTPIAAAAVHLLDAARQPGTLPRSYDAEGVPRRHVTLIEEGVARGPVRDSAAAATAGAPSTGHATRAATLAPHPDHLVLAGGDAAGVEELCDPVADGLFVPAFAPGYETAGDARRRTTLGAARIRGGRLTGRVAPLAVEVAALDVLAAVRALSASQRLVALRGQCPGGSGAAVVPALRATAGVRRVA